MDKELQKRLSNGFTPEQSEYANKFYELNEAEITKEIENETNDDKKFDMVMGALKGVQDKGDAELKKSEEEYKENMRKIRDGKGSILDVYKQYEKEAIERKDFESANKYKMIISQIKEAYSLNNMKELIHKKNQVAVIGDELREQVNYEKMMKKFDNRLRKVHKFKFDVIEDIIWSFNRVFGLIYKLDARDCETMNIFLLKHFNFISVNNNKYFVSKFLFNVKTLAKNENLDEQMEGFKNNLLEVINFVIQMNN